MSGIIADSGAGLDCRRLTVGDDLCSLGALSAPPWGSNARRSSGRSSEVRGSDPRASCTLELERLRAPESAMPPATPESAASSPVERLVRQCPRGEIRCTFGGVPQLFFGDE